jgi:uncharacterized protein
MKNVIILLGIALFLINCGSQTNTPMEPITIDRDSSDYISNISFEEGKLYYENKPFNGEVTKHNHKKGGYLNHLTTYKNGLENGPSYWYYSNGNPYTITPYKNGKIHGLEKKYTEEGAIWISIQYNNDTIQMYQSYANDTIIQRETVLGKNKSLIETYNKSGVLIKKGISQNIKESIRKILILDNRRHGVWEFYNNTGVLEKKEEYMNGKFIREIHVAFNEKYIKKGTITRTFKENESNGKLKCIIRYENGKPSGTWEFYSNSKLVSKEEYLDGKPNGTWQTYSYDGNVLTSISFNNGLLDGIYEEYGSGGELLWKGQFKNGLENGVWKEFDYRGNIKWKEEYKNGKINGIWEEYYSNGQLNWKIEFENGAAKEGGINEMYNEDGSPF